MGRGRFVGGLDVVSVTGPVVFLEDVGTKGPCFGSDGNVLLVLPVWLRDFVWRIESEGKLFRVRNIPDSGLHALRVRG